LTEPSIETRSTKPTLRTRGVGRRFGGLHAVEDVDLEIVAGERRAILAQTVPARRRFSM